MNLWKNLLSLTIGILLVLWLVHHLNSEGLLTQLAGLTTTDYLLSSVAMTLLFLLSGLQLRLALRRSEKVELSMTDVFALPVTQSFWGHVIPVQGSFIYAAAFLKGKYSANVSTTMAVYLFITVCSLIVGAVFGIAHSVFTDIRFLPVYLILVLLPLWLVVGHRLLRAMNPQVGIVLRVKDIIDTVLVSMVTMMRDPLFVVKVVLLDLAYVAVFSVWSFYLSESLDLGVPIGIHVLVSFFLKLTIIAKFTPGNMGVIQLFTGGVFAAYGHPAEAGLLISTLQLGLLVVLSFPVAIVLSLFQFRYMKGLFRRPRAS